VCLPLIAALHRDYSEPHNAQWWLNLQALLDGRFPSKAAILVVAALQLYSDKTQVACKGVSAHPVHLALLNLAYGVRVMSHAHIALLPTLEWPAGLDMSKSPLAPIAKRIMISKCITLLLHSLKQASHSGVELLDPWGDMRLVFPALHSYVADDPECKDLCCIKRGMHPCERCLVHKSALNAHPSVKYPVRDEQQQVAEYQRLMQPVTANQQGRRAAPKLEGAYSTVRAPSPLWGWRYAGNSRFTSSTLAFPYETMHVSDLGVWPNNISLIQPYLYSTCTPGSVAGKISLLNSRMTQLPRGHDFHLPYCKPNGYFPKPVKVQASEHRNVMQILPFLLQGIGALKLQELAIA
jgi:hypothetical protein